MAIKILITLEGSEQVKSAIDELINKGQELGTSLANVGKEGKSPFQEFQVNLDNVRPSLDGAREATNRFREAVHVLHPILRAAGLATGEFSGFARAASAGIAGLGVAIIGGVVVALATLEEQTKKTQAVLTNLFGSSEIGKKAFDDLEQSAKRLGITTEELTPAFESATTALNRFKANNQKFKFVALRPEDLPVGSVKQTAAALESLFKIIRASGQDSTEAAKTAKAFFDALKEGGTLTKDILNTLPDEAIRQLGLAFGRGATDVEKLRTELGLSQPPITRVIELLAKFGPSAQQAFDTKAVKSFRDEFNTLLHDLGQDFQELVGVSFSDFIIKELRQFRTDLLNFINDIKAAIAFIKSAASPQAGTAIREAALAERKKLEAVPPFKLSDLFGVPDAEKGIAELGDKTKEAASSGATAWDQVARSIANSAEIAIKAGDEMLTRWQQLQKTTTQTFKFVSAPALGTSPFAPVPATTPEAHATQVQNLVAPFQEADDQVRVIWIDLIEFINTSFDDLDLSGITQKLVQPFQDAFNQIQGIIEQMVQLIDRLIQKTAELNANFAGFGGQPFGAPFASGGLVRGPGTATSDSILARLSDREFVVNAKAVAFYGADLLHALNSLRLPRNFFEGFNMGGLVQTMARSIPRFADGGQVVTDSSKNRTFTLVLGGRQFGLSGSKTTIDDLEREASLRSLAIIGPAPSFVR